METGHFTFECRFKATVARRRALNLRQIALWVAFLTFCGASAWSQALPTTPGETLTGKRLILADVVRGHAAVIVVGFSREAGDGCGLWMRTLHGDPALANLPVYQIAVLEAAPVFIRSVIKSGMRKGVPAADQDQFLVFTQDEKLWRSYFGVTTDKDPYVVLLDAAGQVRWHGHGAGKDLEPLLRVAHAGQ